MHIPIEIYTTIFFAAVLQSIFGVGVLLIGTPILMLFGYPYFEVLSLTLPTSLVISIIQLSKFYSNINWNLVKKALYFTIPLIPIGMIFASYLGNFVGIFMGVFLFCTSFDLIIKWALPKNASITQLNYVFFFMGLIHGSTNLGGGILPSVVNQKCSSKEEKLATTASIYIMFQVSQIFFILLKKYPVDITNSSICAISGFLAYSIVGKRLFQSIKAEEFSKYLRNFIRFVALSLITIKIFVTFLKK